MGGFTFLIGASFLMFAMLGGARLNGRVFWARGSMAFCILVRWGLLNGVSVRRLVSFHMLLNKVLIKIRRPRQKRY